MNSFTTLAVIWYLAAIIGQMFVSEGVPKVSVKGISLKVDILVKLCTLEMRNISYRRWRIPVEIISIHSDLIDGHKIAL